MLEKYLRPYFQAFCLDPLATRLPKLSPTAVTALATLFGLAAALLIALHAPWLALLALLLSGTCDALDGTLARQQGCTSPLGTVYDILSDRVVEAALIIGLYLSAPATRALPTLLMLATILLCVTSFLVVGIFTPNTSEKSFHYSRGLVERGEAFLFFACMLLFPALFFLLATLFSTLVLLTALIRVVQFANIQRAG